PLSRLSKASLVQTANSYSRHQLFSRAYRHPPLHHGDGGRHGGKRLSGDGGGGSAALSQLEAPTRLSLWLVFTRSPQWRDGVARSHLCAAQYRFRAPHSL